MYSRASILDINEPENSEEIDDHRRAGREGVNQETHDGAGLETHITIFGVA